MRLHPGYSQSNRYICVWQIVGVQPGMTRAREYVGMDVSERLYRARPNRQQRPVAYFRGGVGGHEEEGRGDNKFGHAIHRRYRRRFTPP